MSFPDLHIEADLDGWTDLTTDIYKRNAVTATDGRSNEASQVEPSSLTMTLDNRTGRYSPRNPRGPYYGLLGRNTPIRAYVERGPLALELPGGAGDLLSTPDSAGLSITGDLDVRVDLSTASWGRNSLAGKWVSAGGQRSWVFQITDTGALLLVWTTGGTIPTAVVATSTATIPLYPGRLAVRAALDVDNGSSGNTTTFYTAPTAAGPWVQLGDPVVNSGVTSIFDSTAPVQIGAGGDLPNIVNSSYVPNSIAGRMYAFELRSAGTPVAGADLTALPPTTTAFVDDYSNTWTLGGGLTITNRRWIGHYELSSLPPTSNVSGRDVTVAAEAGGLLRRLGQGSSPLQSTIVRGTLAEEGIEAYWPCEDGSDATTLASALPTGRPMTISGEASLGASGVFVASESLPTVQASAWTGQVPAYTPTGESQTRFVLALPSGGTVNGAVIARVLTTGTAARWDIVYSTANGGNLNWIAYDTDGNTLLSPTGIANPFNGVPIQVSLDLVQNGANVDATLWFVRVDEGLGVGISGTVTSAAFSSVKTVIINPAKAALGDTTVGHISVHSVVSDVNDLADELAGYLGETAGQRIERLCAEQTIVFRAIGSLDETAAMGVQRPSELLELLQECADADLGILFEPREFLGVGYRTRTSMYNQPARAALAMGMMPAGLNSVDDDQLLRNDLEVSRTNGSSARVEETTGPLSVLDPPDGAGRYDDAVTINVASDEQLPDQASWRVHMGTIDEARFPSIPVNFAAPAVRADTGLVEDLLDLQLGDRVTIDDPPEWMPPEQISQLVQSRQVSLLPFQHNMTLNGSPESPYRVGVVEDPLLARVDTDASVLAEAIPAESTTEVTYVNSSATLNATAADNVVVSVPAGTQARHVMVARIGLIGQVAITAPAGWTLIGTQDAGGSTRYATYFKVAGGSEPASYTWSWAGNPFKNSGWIASYSGVDTDDPIADSASTGTGATTAAVDVPEGGLLDVGAFERHAATGSATTWTDASDTERLDHGSASGSGQDMSHAVYTSSGLAAGSYSRTLTPSQTVAQVATWAVALRPASTSTISVATAGWVFEDFEDATLNIDILPAGNGAWARSSASAHTGTWSLKSATITDGQFTDARIPIPTGAITCTFWYRVSSELGFDGMQVFINATLVLTASGDTGWVQATVPVQGIANLTFRYTKDGSDSAGEDAAYIDDLQFTGPALWTTNAGDFPFDIRFGGEVATVSAISGTNSPQTFTVTRSVIVKAHPVGTDVRLAQPTIVAL